MVTIVSYSRGFSTFHALAAAAVSFYLLVMSGLFSEDAHSAVVIDRKSWLSDAMFGVSLRLNCLRAAHNRCMLRDAPKQFHEKCVLHDAKATVFFLCFFGSGMVGFSWLLLDRLGDDPVVLPSPRRKGIRKQAHNFIAPYRIMEQMEVI